MRGGVMVGAAMLVACSVPGLRTEGRELRVSGYQLPADRAAAFDRAAQWFGSRYTILANERPLRLRGERRVDAESINVIDVRLTSVASGTRVDVSGWTDLITGTSRRRADVYSESLRADVTALHDYLACPEARWPRCP